MRWLYMGMMVAVLAGSAVAEEPAKRDFAAGFELLRDLSGMPDLSQAECGTLVPGRTGYLHDQDLLEERGFATIGQTIWKLGDNPDGSARFLVEGVWQIRLSPAPTGAAEPTQTVVTWRPVPVKHLVAELTRANEERMRYRSWRSDDLPTGPDIGAGRQLLAACLLFAAGHRQEANELAGLILTADGASAAVDGAFAAAADQRYESAFGELVATGDQEAFLKALAGLRERFPAGWPRLPGVDQVIRALQQTTLSEAGAAAIGALSLEDQQLLARLRTEGGYRPLPDANGWLLFVPSAGSAVELEGGVGLLLRRGVEALPVLLALALDDRPTRFIDRGQLGDDDGMFSGSRMHYSPQMDFGVDEDEIVAEGGAPGDCLGLPHVLSGREVAGLLLAQFGTEGNLAELEDDIEQDDLLAEVGAWYQSHRGLARRALAQQMLGEPQGRALAIAYLLACSPSDADIEAVQKAILDLSTEEQVAACRRLMSVRGQAARPFIETVVAKLKASEEPYYGEQLSRMLSSVVGESATPELFGAKLAAWDPVTGSKEAGVLQQMATQLRGNVEVAGAVLERVSKDESESPLLLWLLQVLVSTESEWEYGSFGESRVPWEKLDEHLAALGKAGATAAAMGEGGAGSRPAFIRLDLERHREAWKRLLRPDLEESSGSARRSTAANLFLGMYAPADFDLGAMEDSGEGELVAMLPGGLGKLIRERALLLLADPTAKLPPFPSSETVLPARRDEIVADLSARPAPEARTAALALPPDEHLALLTVLDEHPELARNLLAEPRRQFPAWEFEGDVPQPVREALAPYAGRALSQETGQALLATAKGLVEAGYCFVATFAGGPGLNVTGTVRAIGPETKEGSVPSDTSAYLSGALIRSSSAVSVVVVELQAEDGFRATWPVPTAQETAATKAADPDAVLKPDQGAFDLEDAIGGGHDNEASQKALLAALDTIPEETSLMVEERVYLGITGLNLPTWRRVVKPDDGGTTE